MSWERTESELVFFCDAPTCNSSVVYLIAAGADTTQHFLQAAGNLRETRHWAATKQVGREWKHWCPTCTEAAEHERREHERRERERERRASGRES